MKLAAAGPVLEAQRALGFPDSATTARALGALLLACVALHLVPRTDVLGAVLLTGYLGGAVAVQWRAGNPLLTHVLFPVYLGALIWAGLLWRVPTLRTMLLQRMTP